MRRSDHFGHRGRRRGVAAAAAADHAVDHDHAHSGQVAELDAFQQGAAGGVLGVGGLGHGYYASRAVLTDIFQAVLGMEASRRLFIRVAEPNAPENYFIRP